MKYFEQLCRLEEKIEQYYIYLAKLEASDKYDSHEYNECFRLIVQLMNDEKKFFSNINQEELLFIRKKIESKLLEENDQLKILGVSKQVYYARIYDITNSLLGDDLLDYEHSLRYDIHQIIFLLLNLLIQSVHYSNIREYLIFYKYHLLFINSSSEYDFFVLNDIYNIHLESNDYHTSEFLGYKFVDKSILVLESLQDLGHIMDMPNDFRDNEQSYTYATIKIMNLLSRLILCEKDMLPLIYPEFMRFLECEETSESMKELINELLDVLDNLKTKIMRSR